MSIASSYVSKINSIDEALKRANTHIKTLKTEKKQAQERLYKYMVSKKLEEYEGVTLKKIAPKQKVVRKKENEKKQDAMKLFSDIGVDDPETLYTTFVETVLKKKNETMEGEE
jgi:seryl-tRNA synthetase